MKVSVLNLRVCTADLCFFFHIIFHIISPQDLSYLELGLSGTHARFVLFVTRSSWQTPVKGADKGGKAERCGN